MLALFSLILALLLTAAIVIALHRFQENSRANAADREQGLPPLQLEDQPSSSRYLDDKDEKPVESGSEEAPPDTEEEPSQQVGDEIQLAEADTPRPTPPSDWKQHSQQLKEAGNYEAALEACQSAWPQWQSYQQAAVIMRAAIRSTDQNDRDIWLNRLYQLAAEAGFLHDKIDGLPQANWQTLARQFKPADLNAMRFDWQELGYRDMRLLTKTDIRQMTTNWGEPDKHQSAKQHYQEFFIAQSAY